MITFTELLERAKTREIAIHTPTEEQAKKLLGELKKKGYVWLSEDKLAAITLYKCYKENTCYSFYDCYDFILPKQIWWSSFDWYQNEGYPIIEFKDIDFKEK